VTILISLHNFIFAQIEKLAGLVIPTLARLVFAAVLFVYFWNSALTKVGGGIFGILKPSLGAYAQIFPRAMEAVSYDVSQLSFFHWAVAFSGTLAEFVLPVLIVIGLFTRLASIGMIGFVIMQSLTDIYGHGADDATIGSWFDRASDAVIMDQRAFWVFLLIVLVMRGAGPLSVDRILSRRQAESG
jgi:putative oxidoreductase